LIKHDALHPRLGKRGPAFAWPDREGLCVLSGRRGRGPER
jgi:hypothetical protein